MRAVMRVGESANAWYGPLSGEPLRGAGAGAGGLVLGNGGVDLVAPGEDTAFEVGQFTESGLLEEAEGAS